MHCENDVEYDNYQYSTMFFNRRQETLNQGLN